MKREYKNGVKDNADYFIGYELEHNAYSGYKTLFCTGEPIIEEILKKIDEHNANEDNYPWSKIEHVYLGANHSFIPANMVVWTDAIKALLEREIPVTLDIDITFVGLVKHLFVFKNTPNFQLILSAKIANVRELPYDTYIKIDDVGFNKTNPGVWTLHLDSLLDRKRFTSWSHYKNDEVI